MKQERKYTAFFGSEELPKNVAEWWNTIPSKILIGSGRHSMAYLVSTKNNTKYIVRITKLIGLQERQMLEHEIDMYEHLMKSPDYLRNVSELLYADIPSEYHGIEHYDNSYFIFRFVEGVPLDTLIKSFQKNKRYITLEKLRGWGENLLEILEFLKHNKVVHRDVKPANLFLDTTHDRLVLFDFGSACIGEDCKAYQFYGTRDYAKPDSFRLFEHFPNEYIYTSENDAYAVKIIMSRDIQTLVSPESIDQYNQMLNDLGLVL